MYLNVLKKRDKRHHSPSKPFPNLLCHTQAPFAPPRTNKDGGLSQNATRRLPSNMIRAIPFISTLGFFLTSPIIIHRIPFSLIALHFLCSDSYYRSSFLNPFPHLRQEREAMAQSCRGTPPSAFPSNLPLYGSDGLTKSSG